MRYKALGTEGLLIAVGLAGAMSAVAMFVGGPVQNPEDFGLCLYSPNLWTISPLWSWILNLTLIIGIGVTLHFFNKTYSLVQDTDTVLPALFMVMCASLTWIDSLLSSSLVMALLNVIALYLMFGCYRDLNATRQIFVVGTIISIGSMFQYSYVFLIPAYLIIAGMMKCLRFREFIAFLMGLAAPYWVGIGLGIIPLDSFHLPEFHYPFESFVTKKGMLVGMLNIGITALLSILFALGNAVKLYAGNSQRRLYNNSVMTLGLTAILCMVFDSDNLTAYAATFYLTAAVQFANVFALKNVRHGAGWMTFTFMAYAAMFTLMFLGF